MGAFDLSFRKSGIALELAKRTGFVQFQLFWTDLGHSALQEGNGYGQWMDFPLLSFIFLFCMRVRAVQRQLSINRLKAKQGWIGKSNAPNISTRKIARRARWSIAACIYTMASSWSLGSSETTFLLFFGNLESNTTATCFPCKNFPPCYALGAVQVEWSDITLKSGVFSVSRKREKAGFLARFAFHVFNACWQTQFQNCCLWCWLKWKFRLVDRTWRLVDQRCIDSCISLWTAW